MQSYVCDLQLALILLSIVILPHLSWQTAEEQEEISSATKPDFDSTEGEVEAVTQPGNESSGVAGSIQKGPTDNELEDKQGDTVSRERVEIDGGFGNEEGVIPEMAVPKTEVRQDFNDNPNLELGENSIKNTDTQGNDSQGNVGPSDAKQSSADDSFSGDDSNFPEDLSVNSQDDSLRAEDLDEKDWSLLSQWSERRRIIGDEDLRVSFTSEDGEGESSTYQSYINYGVDDDLLEDMTDPPPKPSLTHVQEETTTHLDTIQESDESEEGDDDDGTRNRITMPSQMKSTLSAGMFNLQDISSDGPDEIEGESPDPENDKEEKIISVDLGGPSTSSSSESQSSDEEKEAIEPKDSKKENLRKSRKGRITDQEKVHPIYLTENARTFSNPISYLGGPTIEYDETDETARSKNDSLTSTTSLD